MKMLTKDGQLTTDPDKAHVFIFDDDEEKITAPKKIDMKVKKTEKLYQ